MPRAGENAYAITMVLADLRDPNTLLQVTGWPGLGETIFEKKSAQQVSTLSSDRIAGYFQKYTHPYPLIMKVCASAATTNDGTYKHKLSLFLFQQIHEDFL